MLTTGSQPTLTCTEYPLPQNIVKYFKTPTSSPDTLCSNSLKPLALRPLSSPPHALPKCISSLDPSSCPPFWPFLSSPWQPQLPLIFTTITPSPLSTIDEPRNAGTRIALGIVDHQRSAIRTARVNSTKGTWISPQHIEKNFECADNLGQ